MKKIENRGTRSERIFQVEMHTKNEKEEFQQHCYSSGRTPARVIKMLIRMYLDGKIIIEN